MSGIMSRSSLSPHFSLSITVVKVNLCLIGPLNFVPQLVRLVSVLFGRFQSGLPILIANEWFASSGVASELLILKSSVNSGL